MFYIFLALKEFFTKCSRNFWFVMKQCCILLRCWKCYLKTKWYYLYYWQKINKSMNKCFVNNRWWLTIRIVSNIIRYILDFRSILCNFPREILYYTEGSSVAGKKKKETLVLKEVRMMFFLIIFSLLILCLFHSCFSF